MLMLWPWGSFVVGFGVTCPETRMRRTHATCAELAGHVVVLVNGPMDREWGIRRASFLDPGGHIWEIAQSLESPNE